jgi:hypothetical protein
LATPSLSAASAFRSSICLCQTVPVRSVPKPWHYLTRLEQKPGHAFG